MKSWGSIFAASLGVLFGLIVATAYAQSEEEGESLTEPKPASPSEMEELLVTGTYIQGLTQENLASPLQTISRSEMLDLGAFRLEDIVNNLTINTGSENNPDAFTQNFTSGTSNINLRGLGVASTLVLLNGRRQTYSGFTTDKGENFVDTSSLVPMIAVERVEILKDGAASLYGSDAVAGVVNFITRDNFEGAEVMLESQTGEDQGDLKLGGIYGTGNESTHFIVAFEYLDRDGLGTDERRLSTVEDDTSRAGFPGTFLFPTSPGAPYDDDWNTAYNSNGANGGIADFFEPLLGFPVVPGAEQPAFADPDCTEIAASDDTTVPPDTFPLGPCQFDFGTFFSLVPDEERAQFYTNLNHDINDSLKLFLEAALADNSAQRRNS
ncbi:MAG TPA: TonB-dependent receptor plug domain-containing protein, partial [Gammaproteobacteria bacterium]